MLQSATLPMTSLSAVDSIFVRQQAASGGALFLADAKVSLLRCSFDGCRATGAVNVNQGSGGAVLTTSATTLRAVGCTFAWNTAQMGGALQHTSSAASVSDCTFTANTAVVAGGAVLLTGYGAVITNSVFTRNTATRGAGLSIAAGVCPEQPLSELRFTSNTAHRVGGALHWQDALPACGLSNECIGCTYSANQALYGRDVASAALAMSIAADAVPSSGLVLSAGSDTLDLDVTVRDFFGSAVATLDGLSESMLIVASTRPGVAIVGRSVEAVRKLCQILQLSVRWIDVLTRLSTESHRSGACASWPYRTTRSSLGLPTSATRASR